MGRLLAVALILIAGCGRPAAPVSVPSPRVAASESARYTQQLAELIERLADEGFTPEGKSSFAPDDTRSVLAGFSAMEQIESAGKVRWALSLPPSEAGLELRYHGHKWTKGFAGIAREHWQNASAASVPFPPSIHARVSDGFALLEAGRDFTIEDAALATRAQQGGWTFSRRQQTYDSGREVIVALEQVIDGRRVQMELRDDDSDAEVPGGCGLIDVWVSPPAAP